MDSCFIKAADYYMIGFYFLIELLAFVFIVGLLMHFTKKFMQFLGHVHLSVQLHFDRRDENAEKSDCDSRVEL